MDEQPVIIALDYDGTYTRAPSLWDRFIELAREDGHEVLCVTLRYPEEAIEVPCEVVYTSRQLKGRTMAERMPDIWIDDRPHRIFQANT